MRQAGRRRIIAGTALGAASLLLSTGCSFEFSLGGPAAVDAAQVAERSSEMLAEQVGQAPDSFTCTEDLPAEVDAEIRCELVDAGQTYGVTITTTSVDGDNVQWDIKVDETPTGGSAADDTATDETTAGEGAGENGTAADGGAGGSDDTTMAGTRSVPAAQVAEQSSTMLSQQVGQTPDSFTCSQDLPAEVGAEIRCELVDAGQTYGVTITTTSVDGDNVQWDIKVDDQPQ